MDSSMGVILAGPRNKSYCFSVIEVTSIYEFHHVLEFLRSIDQE